MKPKAIQSPTRSEKEEIAASEPPGGDAIQAGTEVEPPQASLEREWGRSGNRGTASGNTSWLSLDMLWV
ncbi:hypothetical protein Pcinc_002336 [Petrolisthes cinctipes]|uniref:Uncharacterized protein n=1 Tax=Petrolisthes cinctipes TaxID=88211 RepID=A0AAE1GL97_PETCI|nr:hypothetical protein Pcinc_002336 [Petrolisthes cinctipes]